MGIDIDTLVKFNLKKNQMIDAAEMEKIQKYEHYRLGLIWQYNIYHIKTN